MHVPRDDLKRDPGFGVEEVQVADQLEVECAGGSSDVVALADDEVVLLAGEMVDGEFIGPDGLAAYAVVIDIDRAQRLILGPAVAGLSSYAGVQSVAIAADGNDVEFQRQSGDCFHPIDRRDLIA